MSYLNPIRRHIIQIRNFYLQIKGGLGTPEMDLAFGAGGYNGIGAGVTCLGEPLHLDFFGTTGAIHPARGAATQSVFP